MVLVNEMNFEATPRYNC